MLVRGTPVKPSKMVTRCPSCGTAFRVTAGQLEARSGRVRCGRCRAVFDAQATLTNPPATAAGTWSDVDGDPVLDFGPATRSRANWLWWLASALALLVLTVQCAYRYRGEIALFAPETKPVIQRLCAELGCDVPLPRRAELLSIESSDLQADGTNSSVMVLTATLRNRAAFVQALPALELSLTSAQDKTVARRVLMPQNYIPRGVRPESGFAAGSELQVKVYIEAAALKATGYRLYLFYP